MAKVLTDNQHYIDIANAIREKNGTEETYKPGEMAAAIGAIETGGGGLPEEALLLTGNCQYRFAYGGWNWFIEEYGDKITTKDIKNVSYMFYQATKLTNIPFEINCLSTDYAPITSMFQGCSSLKNIPKINNCQPSNMESLFSSCEYLRHIPEDIADWFNWSYIDKLSSTYGGNRSGTFSTCYSLRSVPMDFLRHGNKVSTYSYTYLNNGFSFCASLDELVGLPLPWTVAFTSNAFSSTFNNCNRLKRITFEMPDGQPAVKQWKTQTIDLTTNVGYGTSADYYVLNRNSGITVDKMVLIDTSYQELKDDPDWFTTKPEYSRYNHDSAVETINSLPDTSAYLATAGGTNTIKFKGASGSLTDGGAINTLTEAEIAVATAKGWTVTLA